MSLLCTRGFVCYFYSHTGTPIITLVRKCGSLSIYPKRSLQISTLNFLVTCQNFVTIFMYTPFLCPNRCLNLVNWFLIHAECISHHCTTDFTLYYVVIGFCSLGSSIFWIILPVSSTTHKSVMQFKYVSVRSAVLF